MVNRPHFKKLYLIFEITPVVLPGQNGPEDNRSAAFHLVAKPMKTNHENRGKKGKE